MAYDYEGSALTSRGRVIYERKRHFFGPNDLRRVQRAVQWPESPYARYVMIVVFEELFDKIEWASVEGEKKGLEWFLKMKAETKRRLESESGFGGGQFGGGGATGIF